MTDSELYLKAGIVLALLVTSAFFSGSETALTATSRAKMKSLDDNGNKKAKNVTRLTDDKERLIGAILLGNNLVNILATTLATSIVAVLFPGGVGILIATLAMTAMVVVFSEVLPKTAAIARPEAFAMQIAGPMRWLVFIFAPVTHVVQMIVRSVLRVFGLDVSQESAVLSVSDEIRGAIDLHHEEGRVDKDARDIIRGALDLDDISLEEIMIHRKSMEMIDIDRPKQEIIETVLASNYTRIPLWKENPDNIIGVIHAKDLLREIWRCKNEIASVDIKRAVREPYFVPETTTLLEQLDAFKTTQQHFALIVDEYGALMGLVTLEDILEEIVGEIEDEHDAPVQGVRPTADGIVTVDGAVTIRDLNRAMEWRLPDEAAVTIAGLVIHEAQTIPDAGQIYSFHGFRFEILKRRRNQIVSLKIRPLAASKPKTHEQETVI